jgi:endonuclease-3
MTKIKKFLFKKLKKVYGDGYLWTEVENELKKFGLPTDVSCFSDPFQNLIIGILSQNTSDANSVKTWVGLREKFEITPQVLARAKLKEMQQSIRSGGLYNLKSKRIKDFSKAVLKKFDGDISKLTKLPKEQAREELINLPGIGPKTADVWLSYCSNHKVVAVDTHVDRVTKRLGIVPLNATYEQIKRELEKIFSPKQRKQGHEYLVRLGRDYCKPKNPLCKSCPITKLCPKNIKGQI